MQNKPTSKAISVSTADRNDSFITTIVCEDGSIWNHFKDCGDDCWNCILKATSQPKNDLENRVNKIEQLLASYGLEGVEKGITGEGIRQFLNSAPKNDLPVVGGRWRIKGSQYAEAIEVIGLSIRDEDGEIVPYEVNDFFDYYEPIPAESGKIKE